MDIQRQITWQKRLIHYQMESILKLSSLPDLWTEDSVLDYIDNNKERHAKGASRLSWMLRFWFPTIVLLGMNLIILIWLPSFYIELIGLENLKQADKAFGDAIADSAWGLLFILFMAFVGVPLIVGMAVCFPVVHLALIRHFQKAYVAEHSFSGNPWFCNWWDISTPKHLDVKKQLKIFAWNSILKVYGLGWLGYGVLIGWIIFAIS